MRIFILAACLLMALPTMLKAQSGTPLPGYNAQLYPNVLAAAQGVAKPFLLQQGFQTMAGLTVTDTTLHFGNQQYKVHVRYQNPGTGYYLPSTQYAIFGTSIYSGIWPQQLPNIVYDSAQKTYRGISDCVGYITRLLSATGDTTAAGNSYLWLMDAVHAANTTLFAYRGYVATAYQLGAALPTMSSSSNGIGWQYVCGTVLADSINTYNHSVRPALLNYTGLRRGGFAASRAGDVLAFSYAATSSFNGHAMVLEKAPRLLAADSVRAFMPTQSTANVTALMVKFKVYEAVVFDCSGQAAHFRDSRTGRSGIGHGSLLILTAHSDDAPVAYIFSAGQVAGSTIHYDSVGTGVYAISVGRWWGSSAGISPLVSSLRCSLSPNPAADEILLRFEKNLSGTISLFNTGGQILHRQRVENNSAMTIDLRGLPAGVYVVSGENGGLNFRKTFSKR